MSYSAKVRTRLLLALVRASPASKLQTTIVIASATVWGELCDGVRYENRSLARHFGFGASSGTGPTLDQLVKYNYVYAFIFNMPAEYYYCDVYASNTNIYHHAEVR